jgi:formylglycine-generating enzyme required for sulfatase activity
VALWDAADRVARRGAAEAVAALAPGFAPTEVAVFEAGGVRRDVALFRHAATELEFALVPGGSILPQSASRGGLQRGDASARVRVAPFLASRTPVHQAAWRKVMGANPAFHVGDRLPVEQVNLADALAFCERAGLSLPTEAQWEFACRAGVDAAWCCGDESRLSEHAWFERNSGRSTHPVGEKRPNALGLLDVMGNVWEWCAPEGGDPANARIRGGAWTSEPRQLQSAWSLCYPATTRMSMLGFRPVRALATSEEASS